MKAIFKFISFIFFFLIAFLFFLFRWMKELEELGWKLQAHPLPFTRILGSIALSWAITKALSSRIWRKRD